MKAIPDWDNIQGIEEGGFDRPAPGGYVLRIQQAKDDPKNEYLTIFVDIVNAHEEANKKYIGFYQQRYKSAKIDPLSFRRYYRPSTLPFFKGFITAVTNSNPGFVWKWNEQDLRAKVIGAVLAEEEYRGRDGKVKTALRVVAIHSVDKILNGEYKVPELKKLKENTEVVNGFGTEVGGGNDYDIPF